MGLDCAGTVVGTWLSELESWIGMKAVDKTLSSIGDTPSQSARQQRWGNPNTLNFLSVWKLSPLGA